MRSALLSAVVVAALITPLGRAGDAVDARAMVMLDGGKTVPTNARLLVAFGTYHSASQRAYCPLDVTDEAKCPKADLAFELRRIPDGAKPFVAIAADVRPSEQRGKSIVEIVPKIALSANALHELWLRDKSPLGKHELVAAFVTGGEADVTAPQWQGPMVATWNDGSDHVTKGFELAGPPTTPVLEIVGPPPKDAGPVWYRVWLSTDGPTDFTKPATAWASSARPTEGGKVVLRLSRHQHVAVELPEEQIVHVGLRAIDLAGNSSAPLRFTVDTHKKSAQKPK